MWQVYSNATATFNPETQTGRALFGSSGFADPEAVTPADTGSSEPQEHDMMEPSGSAVDAMTTAMRRAKARLLAAAPEGASPSIEWSTRLTTYSDGCESVDTGWVVAVYLGVQLKQIAFARAATLDDAVLQCVGKLAEWRQEFACFAAA